MRIDLLAQFRSSQKCVLLLNYVTEWVIAEKSYSPSLAPLLGYLRYLLTWTNDTVFLATTRRALMMCTLYVRKVSVNMTISRQDARYRRNQSNKAGKGAECVVAEGVA